MRQIITDEACADGLYSEICYRNGERYIPYVEKLHAAEINRKLSGLPVCRTDQTLVITGEQEGSEQNLPDIMPARESKTCVDGSNRPSGI